MDRIAWVGILTATALGVLGALPACGTTDADNSSGPPTGGAAGAAQQSAGAAQAGTQASNAGSGANGQAGGGGAAAAGASASAGQGQGGEGGEAGATSACQAMASGSWALGDDNLYFTVEGSCVVSNFCSIQEGIHTTGTLTQTELKLESVGGQPLSFAYEVSDDIFTIVDGFQGDDLPLMRMSGALPAECPPP